MGKITLSRDLYTIGIICALFEEKAAMEMMLDEEHEPMKRKAGDNNSYTLGKICDHNVVIACLPGGHQGKSAATAVATHMMISFPIKLGLMVGIGGGVPSRRSDIRLGDVVVSMPEGTHGGVVQYDLGRLESDELVRKGHLGKPPKELLGVVTSLRTKHEIRAPSFPRHLTAILENPMMAEKYGFQGVQHDRLFEPNAIHSGGQDTCDHCVSNLRVVQRADRKSTRPRVFYGTIMSGDLVMKNGQERDRRAAAEKAICFEMEAAGLMNDFPCLVVRGISDYADSHKNDRWQPYAAATAAAYAKELLGALRAEEVENLDFAKKHVVQFSLKGIPIIDHFVQRVSDMQKLEDFFFTQPSRDARRKVFVVQGLGGIGKTQLCIGFVRQHQAKYSAVFWLDGSSEDALQRSFTDVFKRLPADEMTLDLIHAAKQANPDKELIVQEVLHWLSLPSNHRWLIVIDNVDRDFKAQKKDPLAYDYKKYIPTSDHGSILVTSRLSNLVAPQNSLRLTRVDHDQGRAILVASSGQRVLEDPSHDEHDVNLLLEKLSGLPLALTQAGAYILQTGISVAGYLEHYNTRWKQLMEKQDRSQAPSERSVLTTWTMSYEQVDRQSKAASNLMKLWAFLYAGDLWYKLIANALKLASKLDVPEWLMLLAKHRLEFDDALGLLIKYSLVERKEGTHGYSMHAVLHSWCLDLVQSDGENEVFRVLALCILGQAVPTSDIEEYWMLQRRLLPHAQASLHRVEDKERANRDVNECWALDRLANTLEGQDRHAEAEDACLQALAGYEKALGPENESTLGIVNNLGVIYYDQGRLEEAEKMYKRALAGEEKALGPEHTSTLRTVNNLGILFLKQGRLEEAEKMYKRALVGREKALGPEHTSTLDTVNNLGSLFFEQGRIEEAEAMYKRALAGTERALGPEHTSTLDTVYNLGSCYQAQGELAESKKQFERVLAGYEKIYGPKHEKPINAAKWLRELQATFDESSSDSGLVHREPENSKRLNSHISQRTTPLSLPSSTIPSSMFETEGKKHRPRKRDALFRKLRLR